MWFRPSSYLKRCEYCLNCVSLFFRHLSKSTSSLYVPCMWLSHSLARVGFYQLFCLCMWLSHSLGWGGSISYFAYVVRCFFFRMIDQLMCYTCSLLFLSSRRSGLLDLVSTKRILFLPLWKWRLHGFNAHLLIIHKS